MTNLILEEDTVYELDQECLEQKQNNTSCTECERSSYKDRNSNKQSQTEPDPAD